MIRQKTIPGNEVVITELDSDRLNRMCESPQYRATHATLLADLRAELKRGRIIPAADIPRAVVTMRSRVQLRDLHTAEVATFTLVYPDEADIDNGNLSVLAPLGTVLLGARRGATIHVKVPAGIRHMKIEKILYQPEAAGDRDL